MNPQIKQKWVSALRSGDYQQGQCYLRTNSGFCCLGVLCDLYGKEHNVEWNLANNGHNYEFQEFESYLPSSVRKWADLEYCNPPVNDEESTLVRLNDSGSTFEQIADVIEEQL
jgi:hypothetical protein